MVNTRLNGQNKFLAQPTLKQLQDVYTYSLDCDNNLSLQPGDSLGVFDDHVFEIYNEDQKQKAVTSRNPSTILKDFHLAALYRLKRVGEYIQGEYSPTSKDEDFLNEFQLIHPEFIEGWYWGIIYIGYGEDLIEQEKIELNKQGLIYKPHKAKFLSRFRLYKRIDEDNKTKPYGKYTSVLSGVTNLRIENERLIPFTCNEGSNWIEWWDLVREYNAGNQKFITAFNASIKRISVMVSDRKRFFEQEAPQLNNNSIYLYKLKDQTKELNNNKEKSIEIISPELASQILNLNQAYFEIKAAWFGFAGKGTNNKTERLTAGENFQTLKLPSNIQEHNLRKLNSGIWQMKQLFGEVIPKDFKYEISGQTLAMGLPEAMRIDKQEDYQENNQENYQEPNDELK